MEFEGRKIPDGFVTAMDIVDRDLSTKSNKELKRGDSF